MNIRKLYKIMLCFTLVIAFAGSNLLYADDEQDIKKHQPPLGNVQQINMQKAQLQQQKLEQQIIGLLKKHAYDSGCIPKIVKLGKNTLVPILIKILGHKNDRLGRYAAIALGEIGTDAVPALIKSLTSKNKNMRMHAAKALGNIGPKAKKAVPYLIKALADDNKDVREYSAYALGQIGTDAVPALIKSLANNNRNIRYSAADALSSMRPGPKQALPALIKLLEDADKKIRAEAARAIEKIGPEANQAVPFLINHLNDQDKWVICASARALGRIGPKAKQAVPALAKLLIDTKLKLHDTAARALGRIGTAAIPLLINNLTNKDKHVRMYSADALGDMGPQAKQAVPALIKAMADNPHDVKLYAVIALGKIGPEAKQAISALLKIVNDKKRGPTQVSSQAVRALIKMGPKAVVLAINASVNKNEQLKYESMCYETAKALRAYRDFYQESIDPLIRTLRNEAVSQIVLELVEQARYDSYSDLDLSVVKEIIDMGEKALPGLILALNHQYTIRRVTTIEILERFKPEDVKQIIPSLITKLKDKHSDVRKAAIKALGKFRPEDTKQAIPGLIANLDVLDPYTRRRAAEALGNFGPLAKQAVMPLIKSLFYPDNTEKGVDILLQREAEQALIKILSDKKHPLTITQILFNALTDKNKDTRSAAAEALGSIDADQKQIVPILIKALKDKSPDVRAEVICSLGKIKSEHKKTVPVLIKALSDKTAKIRKYAANALGELGSKAKQAEPVLFKMLDDKDPEVGKAAIYALVDINIDIEPEKAALILFKSLLHNDEFMRLYAIVKLVELEETHPEAIKAAAKKTVPILVKALLDINEYRFLDIVLSIRSTAFRALNMSWPGEKQFITELIKTLKNSSNEYESIYTIALLSRKDYTKAIAQLITGLQQAIIQNNPALAKKLENFLKNMVNIIRPIPRQKIIKKQNLKALDPHLIKMLKSKNKAFKQRVMKMLEEIPIRDILIDTIIIASKETNHKVREKLRQIIRDSKDYQSFTPFTRKDIMSLITQSKDLTKTQKSRVASYIDYFVKDISKIKFTEQDKQVIEVMLKDKKAFSRKWLDLYVQIGGENISSIVDTHLSSLDGMGKDSEMITDIASSLSYNIKTPEQKLKLMDELLEKVKENKDKDLYKDNAWLLFSYMCFTEKTIGNVYKSYLEKKVKDKTIDPDVKALLQDVLGDGIKYVEESILGK